MSSTTGIELGPESCVLAGVRPTPRAANVFALHVIDPSQWPAQTTALSETLRVSRKRRRLPRRAHVVAWGLPESASLDDPATAARLRPITDAGFKIEAILTPPQALALLEASRPRDAAQGATAWLSINTHGAAIAIVQAGELLYARTFDWSYKKSPAGSAAQLLQRYSLVAHLAPELSRGIVQVRSGYGVTVETAVTCGDLPDLRSLTMPLIEELDIEVETLDSLDGLDVTGSARGEKPAESAPAIRLAIAAAAGPPTSARTSLLPRLLRAAAAIAIVGGIVWTGYALWKRPLVRSADSRVAGTSAPVPRSAPTPVTAATPAPKAASPGGASPSNPALSAPARGAAASGAPAAKTAAAPVSPGPRQSSRPVTDAVIAQAPPDAAPVRQAPPPDAAPTRQAPPPDVAPTRPPRAAQAPVRAGAPGPAAPRIARRQIPLDAPLPRVDSILVDSERRLAIVDGQILSIGGAAGRRVVVRIDPDAIIFREPSGLDVRVALGSRGRGSRL